MIHIHIWQKNYSSTYLGLVTNFEERQDSKKCTLRWTLSHTK